MSFLITFKKMILGFLTGLAAVVVLGVVQSISDYQCDAEVSGLICQVWLLVVPIVTSFLVGIANWLKNRNK